MVSLDLLIYGSCVSRDMLEEVHPPNVELRHYIARQSWCSIGYEANDERFRDVKLSSAFEERNYTGDLAGDAFKRISMLAKKYPELVLILDLTDERGGFYRSDDGAVITRTFDSPAVELVKRDSTPWKLIPFGSMWHLLAFAEAAQTLQENLRELGIFERTVVVQNRWARTSEQGEPTPRSFAYPAGKANTAYREYFDLLRELGWTIAAPRIDQPLADTEHKWGFAPFHYTREYYHAVWDAIHPKLPSADPVR